jgi:ligand-binding sensor protein
MIDAKYLVDGKYGIVDLVDLVELRRIFERFTEATGFTIGFLDHPGLNILIDTGWRDICTKFHRCAPGSAANCTQSNRHLLDNLDEPGCLMVEKCENGLVDCAFPIIVKGKHMASLATGQLLLEKPNLKRLFMSGYTADVIAHHGVIDEGVDFIQKPFSMQDLADRMRKVLDAN